MSSPSWNCYPPHGCVRSAEGGAKAASNTSLIDWDKSVLNYVYACMHPEPPFPPHRPTPYPHHPNSASTVFCKAHRRIVSATSPHAFQIKPPRLVIAHVRGHCRNASDPGMHIYFPPPPPLFLPSTAATIVDEKECNLSNVDTPPRQPPPSPLPPSPLSDRIDKVDIGASKSPSLPTAIDKVATKGTACLISCLQPLANSVILLISLCAMALFQALVSSGYLSSIITTLERRFDLTSRQVGYMYCCYEMTSVFSTIWFSFVNARRHNRPRIIGLLGIVLGLGFGLFALPHWLSGSYNPGKVGMRSRRNNEVLCSIINTSGTTPQPPPFIDRSYCNQTEVTLLRIGQESVIASDYTVALPVFCCAMALAGFGSSSLFVLAPTFFWDNLSPKQYPLYSGLLYSSAGLGPAFGFMAGAAFLQIYIDTPSIQPPSASQLDAYSQSWLGAWWLGMVIFGVIACLTSLPVLAFPRRLPNPQDSDKCGEVDVEGGISCPSERPAAKTTALSTPENDGKGGLATGGFVATSLHPISTTIPGRFPEPISEASESLVLHSPPLLSPEVECKLHRRQGSRGAMPIAMQQSLTSKGVQPTPTPPAFLATPLNRRSEKGSSSMCACLQAGFSRKFRGRTRVFWRVVTNPVWLGVTATTVTENTIVSAYLTYAAKYLQAQFRTPAHLASIHTGAVVVPSAVLGVLTGALLMRRFRPSIKQTLLASLVPLFATLATVLILMLGLNCSANQMAGVTATYDGISPISWRLSGSLLRHPFNLTAPCNSLCRVRVDPNSDDDLFSCPLASDYNPVCWESSIPASWKGEAKAQMSFLNPCLAGCVSQGFHTEPDGKVVEIYTDCNCVTNTSLVPEGVHSIGGSGIRGITKKGVCRPQCLRYAPFLIVTFLTIFLTSINQNPSNVITLSCVAPDDGTAALGLQVFFSRTLAFIPTPIYFGALMDRTCRVRALPQRLICESQQHHLLLLSATKLASLEGACLEYDVHALPFAWLGGVTVFKCLSILIAILTWRYSCRLDARQKRNKAILAETGESQLPEAQGG
ncbi:Solute carrier organic anion transporter family member 5A1 [Echinococcus granulosus]|uniref:Solute carrier organic anion transporter family n=1 Tax=Echinococcus granulosus TaxID=6210 RepID=A0A068WX07_ECHGR|nr:Solute carrier organic anion transporter family member 5A1 [Echinococcus granulosus]CDS22241.1 Solute carrier organic anion transporter family [Echinococcus granulosus]